MQISFPIHRNYDFCIRMNRDLRTFRRQLWTGTQCSKFICTFRPGNAICFIGTNTMDCPVVIIPAIWVGNALVSILFINRHAIQPARCVPLSSNAWLAARGSLARKLGLRPESSDSQWASTQTSDLEFGVSSGNEVAKSWIVTSQMRSLIFTHMPIDSAFVRGRLAQMGKFCISLHSARSICLETSVNLRKRIQYECLEQSG